MFNRWSERVNRWARAGQWVLVTGVGMGRFLIKDPRATVSTTRWALGNILALPMRATDKSDLDARRARLAAELAEARRVYLEDMGLRDSADLRYLQRSSDLLALKRWCVVYALLRAAGCRTVVETGVAEGQSTAHILQAIVDNGGGTLHSVDLPNHFYMTDQREFHAEVNLPGSEPGCLVPEDLQKHWTLTLGRSRDTLPRVLDRYQQVDAFLHDSEHTYDTMTFEFETAWPHIRKGGYMMSDDATWSGALMEFAERHGVEAVLVGGEGFDLGFVKKP